MDLGLEDEREKHTNQKRNPCVSDRSFFLFFLFDTDERSRKSSPEHQFCVLNRLSTENVVEDLQEGFAYEVSGPYLLYKNRSGQVIGIWFYEARELSAVIGLLQQIMGDTMQPSDTTSGRIQEKESVAPVQETDVGAVENHDIIRMLSQAKVVVDTERIPSSLEPTSRSPVKAVPEADAESGPTLLAPSFFSSKHSASPAPLTKEKLRLAMQRLVQNEQFIEMLYQELLEP